MLDRALNTEPSGLMSNRVTTRFITSPEETEHGTRPGGRGPGGVPGGVGSNNRGGMYAYTEGVFPYTEGGLFPIAILSVCVCVSVCLSVVFYTAFLYRMYLNWNYFGTCGVASKRSKLKKAPALPQRCTTRAKPHFRSFNLKVGNLEHQDTQVWFRAHPFRPTRTAS